MSLADQLLYLFSVKSDIKEAIQSKGVTVADNIPFEEYPSMVDEIYKGVVPNSEKDNLRSLITRDTIDIIIPEDVTSLKEYAYAGFKKINSINFGNITTIPSYCFYKSTGPQTLDLTGITTLSDQALLAFSGIQKVILDTSITSLPSGCFNACNDLTEINLENVTQLGGYCFMGCNALQEVTLNPTITTLPYSCFKDSGLTHINMDNIQYIGLKALSNTKLTELDLINITSWPNYGGVQDLKELRKVWYPSTLRMSPFPHNELYGCKSGTIIFTDATSKPDIWLSDWDRNMNVTVRYGSTRQEYFDY